MKKLLSLVMVAVMMSNTVSAATVQTNNTKIAKAFNDFRYKMTVEMNANDSGYQEAAMAEFKANIEKLQAEGVSAPEIMDFMRVSLLDQATRADFDRLMATMDSEKISSEEAGNIAMQFMAGKYQQGANYSGGGKGNLKRALFVIGVVIVGVVTYYLIKHIKKCKADTVTVTNNTTSTVTNNTTSTVTNNTTSTVTETNTVTNTVTETNTVVDRGYCCNAVVGRAVPATETGCMNGDALVWTPTIEACTALGPSSGWDDNNS